MNEGLCMCEFNTKNFLFVFLIKNLYFTTDR